MKINYEVNIYSHNTNAYECADNYFNDYNEALDNFNMFKETLILGEELNLYMRTLNDTGEEIKNEILKHAEGDEIALGKIERSFRHGDCIVLRINKRVFVAEEALKHAKEATIEFKDCYEIDNTCFEANGDYIGETLSTPGHSIILSDPYADNPNAVASHYFEDEIVEGL